MVKFKLFLENGSEIDDWYPTLEAAKEAAVVIVVRDPYVESVSVYKDSLFCGKIHRYVAENPARNGSRWNPSKFIEETVKFFDK